jgi:recombinational DNA repair ATPase RecF
MSGTLDEIRAWAASELKRWERAALEKISTRHELTESDLEELVEYFKQDAGLGPIPQDQKPGAASGRTIGYAKLAPRHLERIFNLRNVNALPEGQEIRFGRAITIIYGENGAGKTGYARPLACAGFARGDREVLPNASLTHQVQPQADIEVSYGDTKETLTWFVGHQLQELSGFPLFDGNSATVHLTHSNSLNYSPAGLSFLTRLADVTDQVRERIKRIIEELERPTDFQATFEGDSKAKTAVKDLSAVTDLNELEKLAKLSPEEDAALGELEKEIARLNLEDTAKLTERLKREIADLEKLIVSIDAAQTACGEVAEALTTQLIADTHLRRNDVAAMGASQFTFQSFKRIGSDEWLDFLQAAHALAVSERPDPPPYPQVGDHCLLCRQTLPSDATELIQKLWQFITSDSGRLLEAAERACSRQIATLKMISLDYFSESASARRLLEAELPLVVPGIESQIEAARTRRDEIIDSLSKLEARALPPLISIDTTDLKSLIDLRKGRLNELANSDHAQRLNDARKSFRELNHRRILAKHIQEIRSQVERKRRAERARRALGSTRAITTKYNELFRTLVTEKYTALFEQTLQKFKPDMKVTVETRGFKGETVRQIVFRPKSNPHGYSIDRILSEGEKRAVAISDFLTETSMDQSNCGIILDDPVTSMDERWKATLAQCLAERAKSSQVIVFTHDLAFIYRIKKHCEELELDVSGHWIREEDGAPGFVYLDNSPVCEREFRNAQVARDFYAKSKGAEPAQEQYLLQQGFGALRSSYEALIVFEIFNDVVGRFEERISFGRLSQVCLDDEITRGIVARMEGLSGYIDAHLHSDRYAGVKPNRADLLKEIDAFESIKQRHKELKKEKISHQ